MSASNPKASAAGDTADRELVIKRVFNAPRELVYLAWTDPKHLVHWYGPNGFTTTVFEMDVRPGGVWRLVMRGPDGRDYHNRIVFLEVAKPERLVYKHDPEKGSEPVTFETTVTFVEQGDKTEVTMRQLFPSREVRDDVVKKYGAVEGAKQTFGRLEQHVAKMSKMGKNVATIVSERELLMTRVFDAPRELVFRAWSTAEHFARWIGPDGLTVPICKVEFRAGGVFIFVMRAPDGTEYPFKGSFVEIVPPEKIVFQGNIHNVPGQDVMTTVMFAEEDGKTKLTVHQAYTFVGDATRGAPYGWSSTLDNLAEFVAKN